LAQSAVPESKLNASFRVDLTRSARRQGTTALCAHRPVRAAASNNPCPPYAMCQSRPDQRALRADLCSSWATLEGRCSCPILPSTRSQGNSWTTRALPRKPPLIVRLSGSTPSAQILVTLRVLAGGNQGAPMCGNTRSQGGLSVIFDSVGAPRSEGLKA
jgi:hypothetical protein